MVVAAAAAASRECEQYSQSEPDGGRFIDHNLRVYF